MPVVFSDEVSVVAKSSQVALSDVRSSDGAAMALASKAGMRRPEERMASSLIVEYAVCYRL